MISLITTRTEVCVSFVLFYFSVIMHIMDVLLKSSALGITFMSFMGERSTFQ